METAGSFVENPRTGNHPPVHVLYRVEAARLLAYMGSRETIPFLADLFTRDPDGLVKAAAAEAIGRIGVDPEGFALKAFTSAVFPPFPLRDEAALTATAAATGALCRFSGPPLSDAGIRLLTTLAAREQSPPVRLQAERELRSLNSNIKTEGLKPGR
jgi:outer membrane protein assembly factor BamB